MGYAVETMHDPDCEDGGWCEYCRVHGGEPSWETIEKRGGWEIQRSDRGSLVVEYVPREYWFEIERVATFNWVQQIEDKNWGTPDVLRDLAEILAIARGMVK